MNFFLYFFVGVAYASDGLRNDADAKQVDWNNPSDGVSEHSDASEPVGTSEQTAPGDESVQCYDESDECPICLDACQHRSSSALIACGACGKKFHLGCLRTDCLSKCPNCRQPMDKDINAIVAVTSPQMSQRSSLAYQQQIDGLESRLALANRNKISISEQHTSLSLKTKRFSLIVIIIELFVDMLLSQFCAISTEFRLSCVMTALILHTWMAIEISSNHEKLNDRVKAGLPIPKN